MRVLVCGGRKFSDDILLFSTLDQLRQKLRWREAFDCIIEGEASGADRLAARWARANHITVEPYKADWDNLSHPDAVIRIRKDGSKYDAMAGLRRNQRMIDEGKPDLVVKFPGGGGTADMVRRAKAAGIKVLEVG